MMIKSTCTLVLFCFCLPTQSRLADEQRLRAEQACVDRVGIDYTVILRVKDTLVVPTNHTQYRDFLTCFWKAQGYVTDDGSVAYDEIKDLLLTTKNDEGLIEYTEDEIDGMVETCRKAGDGVEVEAVAISALRCIFRSLPDSDKFSGNEV